VLTVVSSWNKIVFPWRGRYVICALLGPAVPVGNDTMSNFVTSICYRLGHVCIGTAVDRQSRLVFYICKVPVYLFVIDSSVIVSRRLPWFTSFLYMPRRFRRYARSARTVRPVRYSNETVSFTTGPGATIAQANTVSVVMVKATETQGVRKMKNPTLKFTCTPTDPLVPILWALVYIPEGFPDTALKLRFGASPDEPSSIFEPNQNVMISGILPAIGTSGTETFRSRLARNIQSGDKIVLLFLNPMADASVTVGINCVLNYAMCYG
jgi:hypothetical protein